MQADQLKATQCEYAAGLRSTGANRSFAGRAVSKATMKFTIVVWSEISQAEYLKTKHIPISPSSDLFFFFFLLMSILHMLFHQIRFVLDCQQAFLLIIGC